MAYGEFVVLWVVLETENFPLINAIIYTALTVMALWAHLKTMLTEPGVVPRAAMPLPDEEGSGRGNHTLCGRCEAYKPVRYASVLLIFESIVSSGGRVRCFGFGAGYCMAPAPLYCTVVLF